MTYARYTVRMAVGVLAAGLVSVSSPPAAVGQQDLTVERIYGSGDFSGQSVRVRWMPDGLHWSTIERDSAGHSELWQVDARTGQREKLISAAEFHEAAAEPVPDGRHIDGNRISRPLAASICCRLEIPHVTGRARHAGEATL